MTAKEHIVYHADKINRLYAEMDNLSDQLFSLKSVTGEELMNYAMKLLKIEKELRSSIDVRMAMKNLEA